MTDTHAKISDTATFNLPYPFATLNNRPVRLMATGNIEGKSAGFQYVDELGKCAWESQDKFIITDPNLQPSASNLVGHQTTQR